MGPQFNVFSKLKKINIDAIQAMEEESKDNLAIFTPNPKFPIYSSGLLANNYYKCLGKRMKFGTGSYKEYTEFKKHLVYMTGFKNEEEVVAHGGPVFFQELIKYDDKEGVLGPIICRKLYNDFKDNYDVAKVYFERLENTEKKYLVHYQNWCKALFVAKQNGAILIN